jgi:hypothetical protein
MSLFKVSGFHGGRIFISDHSIPSSRTHHLLSWFYQETVQPPHSHHPYQFLLLSSCHTYTLPVSYLEGWLSFAQKLIPDITAAQQAILRDVYETDDISSVPQMWAMYKEVGEYYQHGVSLYTFGLNVANILA